MDLSYIVLVNDDFKKFSDKTELLKFLKKEFNKCKNKINVVNRFYVNRNIIELDLNAFVDLNNDNNILISIGDCENNKSELTKDLYYEIGKYLNCFSRII